MARNDPQNGDDQRPLSPWRERMHEVIFETDTVTGKVFDVALLVAIVLSVLAVMLESVADIRLRWGDILFGFEWFFTILFTVEYVARMICVRRPLRYAVSFFGIVDLLAVLPTYLSLFVVGTHSLIVIRTLRLIRVFRVFKLTRYLTEARALVIALRATRAKITVFLVVLTTIILILGSLMYLIEGPERGFTSIPKSVYWAIVTMTTVGYGDISPSTPLGQTLAAVAMIIGYSIIIVPTGIFSYEVVAAWQKAINDQACPSCGGQGHDFDAKYCKHCGSLL